MSARIIIESDGTRWGLDAADPYSEAYQKALSADMRDGRVHINGAAVKVVPLPPDPRDVKIAELERRCDEYERQPEYMAETAQKALDVIKSQDAVIAELYAVLREAMTDVCGWCLYCERKKEGKYDCTNTDGGCHFKKWRAALAKAERIGGMT